MSIVFSLECDVCGRLEVLNAVTTLTYAQNLQQPYGKYEHVCNVCHNDLERERLYDEAQKLRELGGL